MKIVIIDFDNTITKGEAFHLIPSDLKNGDWTKYLQASDAMPVRESVLDYILRTEFIIVVLTARGAERVAQVERYLKQKKIRHLIHQVVGRPVGYDPNASSGKFKGEYFDRWLAAGHEIALVIDDHPEVINAAQSRGIRVWNPA